jgi:hypothetical protein
MKATHDYAARIDYDLWMDCLKVKQLDATTTSINSMVNEGLKMVRDRKMQEICKISSESARNYLPIS